MDLDPPRKSRRINKVGRTLALTPDLLVAGTTGISQPLADPAKVAEYLASGDTGKLVRRIESDVKASTPSTATASCTATSGCDGGSSTTA